MSRGHSSPHHCGLSTYAQLPLCPKTLRQQELNCCHTVLAEL